MRQPLPADWTNGMTVTRRPGLGLSLTTARSTRSPSTSARAALEGFGFDATADCRRRIRAAGAVLDYLAETQKASLAHIDRLLPYSAGRALEIDEATRRSLEITARSATAAARARCWPCSTAPSRRWARGCWPTGSPIR